MEIDLDSLRLKKKKSVRLRRSAMVVSPSIARMRWPRQPRRIRFMNDWYRPRSCTLNGRASAPYRKDASAVAFASRTFDRAVRPQSGNFRSNLGQMSPAAFNRLFVSVIQSMSRSSHTPSTRSSSTHDSPSSHRRGGTGSPSGRISNRSRFPS